MKVISNEIGVRPRHVLVMPLKEAKKLIKEIQPQLDGMVIGEFPLYEELCRIVKIDPGFVS